jgi:hypothetical protein
MMVKEVIEQTIESLKSSPMLLGVILLNAMMVAGAGWFLASLATAQQARFQTLMQACLARLS